MATARVGGTRTKIKGQVGNTIFQVRKNADGTYTQIVYSKGERTETTLTPKLQAQRMCAAMVQSLMRDLKPIANISFESGKNKSQSLNAFSSWNLNKLNSDCKNHWYGQSAFVYPRRHRTDIAIQDLGGLYLISSGSLTRNIFDRLAFDQPAYVKWLGVPNYNYTFYGLEFSCQIGTTTIGQFRKLHRMTVRDVACFAAFREWLDYSVDPEDPTEYKKHIYLIASQLYTVPESTIMTEEVIRSLFLIDSSVPAAILMARNGQSFAIGYLANEQEDNDYLYYTAGFSISYADGKKRISSSTYANPDGDNTPYDPDAYPANVFGSWMGEPSVVPYPSPWGQPVPWRIPVEYQEVEWIKYVSGNIITMPEIFKPMVARLEFRVVGDLSQMAYVFDVSQSTKRLIIYCALVDTRYRIRFSLRGNTTQSSTSNYFQENTAFDSRLVFEARNGKYLTICNGEERETTFAPFVYDDQTRAFTIFGNPNTRAVCQIYEMIATDVRDGSLMFDLVPCYRKTNGFCGFYDLETQQFYSAQQNVGEYEHGPLINR